jgi:RimJ/RimL family protein N-acetyltransferase
MMIMETERLRLRPIEEKDVPFIVPMMNDWEVAQWLSLPPYPYYEKDGQNFIDIVAENHRQAQPTLFGIARRHDDQIMGSIGGEWATDNECGIGYWMGRDHWKQGYAREAMSAMIAYVRDQLACRSMMAVIDPDNQSSRQLLERFNFISNGSKPIDTPTRRGCTSLDIYRLSFG